MRKILLSDIIIRENRQRTEFDSQALADLKESIEQRGLMHPPVLRSEGPDMVLVAGERRLRAIAEMHELGSILTCDGEIFEEGWCPYTTLGDLSPLEAEEAELDENLKRMDLTWQEHAAATARLHKLRLAQRAEENAIASSVGEPVKVAHTVAETALELLGRSDGAYQDQIRKEIIVAKHLANPAIAKAKSADEAFKILKKAEEAEKNVELARTVGATFNADLHMLLQRDCLGYMEEQVDIVKNCPEEAFDVILTDPPYGMGADQFGDAGGKMAGIEHRYDDSSEAWRMLMTEWTELSYLVTKPKAHAYVFCDFDKFHELKQMMELAGWYVFRTPLVVHKLNSGRVPLPDQGPRRQYEIILYAIKGKKQTTHIYPDVIPCGADENMSHGAQKPVALFQNLLQRSVQAGDRVLDTFAGSGTIFEAAHAFKVTAVGVERNQEYYGMCLTRLARLKQLEQPSLI
jgi:DNA modification methylase